MRLALVYPPACDPTAPYLALPALTGFLRARGVQVLPIDANVEAFDALLDPAALGSLRERLEARLAELDRKPALEHGEQLEILALLRARGDAHAVPHGIARAKKVLRDRRAFYDPDAYASAVATIDAALRVVSAAHHPLQLDFMTYRTPFGLTGMGELDRAGRAGADPFDSYVMESLVPRLREAKAFPSAFPGRSSLRTRSRSSSGARCRACTSPAEGRASRRSWFGSRDSGSRGPWGRSTRPVSSRESTRCFTSCAHSETSAIPANATT
jgi:hypothetical protein